MVQLWAKLFEGSSEYAEGRHCPSQRPQKSDVRADRDFVKFSKTKSEVWQSGTMQRKGLGWLATEKLGSRSMELVVDTRLSPLVSSALLQWRRPPDCGFECNQQAMRLYCFLLFTASECDLECSVQF